MPHTHNAKESVINVHNDIAKVFTQHNPDDLRQLFTAFHPDFTMVTMAGQSVLLQDVKNLFTRKQGTRPNLLITVEAISIITESADRIWLQYKEIHIEHAEIISRLSTVCIAIDEDKYQWLYLHETMIKA